MSYRNAKESCNCKPSAQCKRKTTTTTTTTTTKINERKDDDGFMQKLVQAERDNTGKYAHGGVTGIGKQSHNCKSSVKERECKREKETRK